jgi:hypothetical protein
MRAVVEVYRRYSMYICMESQRRGPNDVHLEALQIRQTTERSALGVRGVLVVGRASVRSGS